uniref:Uncharacterized protein n=1 Tax=Panagrolaimus sp. JU765 TaxID=591449 RepID=A0AC34RJ46_9BILA
MSQKLQKQPKPTSTPVRENPNEGTRPIQTIFNLNLHQRDRDAQAEREVFKTAVVELEKLFKEFNLNF